ncbi:MAG: redoxin family protein, partial [Leadbetterella sp.]
MIFRYIFLSFFTFSFLIGLANEEEPKTLTIGSQAPNFNLKGIDGKIYNLQSFKSAKILVILFTSNHCPTAQAYEDRIIEFDKKYKTKGVKLVAINPNSEKSVRYDELSYSDLNDGYMDMKIRA